ncbi:hypothetical protein ACKWTF_012677 [Chironomus riparius]
MLFLNRLNSFVLKKLKLILNRDIIMYSDWSYGLIKVVNEKRNILLQSETLAVIRDSFPKATFHFLVIPFDDDLDTIYDLNDGHLDLIDEFELLGINVVEATGNKVENFAFGFHAKPSMRRLHLHVVSKDFNSQCLKHKKHWNSFNTDFLVPVEKVRNELKSHGHVQQLSDETLQKLINTPLKCNTCSYIPKHMPDLKKHLITHLPNYIDKNSSFLSLFEKNG